MKPIEVADFGPICTYGDDIQCVVTYVDGTTEVFNPMSDEEFKAVHAQLELQYRLNLGGKPDGITIP